jgi:uncharacterized cupin superfamily protein
MELPTGVFVAKRSTDEWEPDPDVGGLMHVMCDVPGVQAGFTRFDTSPASVSWTPPVHESLVIVQGAARIEFTGGRTLELHEGDTAALAAGTETTWHITAPFLEFWVLSGDRPDVR